MEKETDVHEPPVWDPKTKRPKETYKEPEPILDSSSDFEKMDRGEGMGVDDVKTYHRTEK